MENFEIMSIHGIIDYRSSQEVHGNFAAGGEILKSNPRQKLEHTIPTVKHGGGGIIVWRHVL